ncbi:DUF4374 domain-containing protein [Chondromyces crocatus]|nr:DUF4374 domain-containing protein [Chondromyces crocatus]
MSLVGSLAGGTLGCSDAGRDGVSTEPAAELYSVGSIVQSPEGRTLLVQTLRSLDEDTTNENALEFAGNSRHWAHGGAVFIGLDEEPTIEKYVPDEAGVLQPSGRVSFLSFGLTSIPAGNIFLAENKAYLMAEGVYKIIVWNPSTMEIDGEIDLAPLKREGFDIEIYYPNRAGNRVYTPLRYVNFAAGEILHEVGLVQIDTDGDVVVADAHDDRCVGASQPAIADDGTLYVLADGRSYLAQLYATQRMTPPPKNCILRILPGETTFDPDFYTEIQAITGGKEVVTPLWYAGGGVGVAKMFYPDQIPPGTDTSGYKLWYQPAFKLWRIELGDTVRAEEVPGAPFSMNAFGGVTLDGRVFIGETEDGATSTIYEVDPDESRIQSHFVMEGLMRDLYKLR